MLHLKHELQSDREELKWRWSVVVLPSPTASIGPGGIEMAVARRPFGRRRRLQSDREELKYIIQLAPVLKQYRFNRTGRN